MEILHNARNDRLLVKEMSSGGGSLGATTVTKMSCHSECSIAE